MVVEAPAAPTSAEPPHTTQPNKVLITPHSFLSKCLPNHKRVTGLGGWLASTTAGAWCTGKHSGPEALIKTAMTPLRCTHVCTLSLSYKPSLVWVYQPQGLEYISRLYCRCQLIGLSMEMYEKTGSDRLCGLLAAAHQRTSPREILNGSPADMLDHDRWRQWVQCYQGHSTEESEQLTTTWTTSLS